MASCSALPNFRQLFRIKNNCLNIKKKRVTTDELSHGHPTLELGTFNPWIDRRAGARDRRKHLESSPLGAVLNEPIPRASLPTCLDLIASISFFASRHRDVWRSITFPIRDHAHTTSLTSRKK